MHHIVCARDLLTANARHDLDLTLIAGDKGPDRPILHTRIQKPGLALAGFTEAVQPARIQILGNTELTFLYDLKTSEERVAAVRRLFDLMLVAVIVTSTLPILSELEEEAIRTQTPLFKTGHMTANFITRIEKYLEEVLKPSVSVHGVLCGILGIGVLLLGKSGIGKSEAALDLIMRGHQLVADDVVEVKALGRDELVGMGSELIKHHMEIRGIGIINVKEMFGISSICDSKKIVLVIELVEWSESGEYERLGLEEEYHQLLDVRVPKITLPVRPGRNMASIVEVAARNQLLKMQGYHAARVFQERLTLAIDDQQKRALLETLERKSG